MPTNYVMKISRLTVDKLGVKLYDRVSAVIAELVANSYDADATKVTIIAPMGELLANKQAGKIVDKGMVIEVTDNGIGMTPREVNDFYLKVGAERRADPRRGDRSLVLKRAVMGRKGVGKLAPFGICRRIEVISSGGDPIERPDELGNRVTGYVTAHLVLDRDEILNDTDEDYVPESGSLDETLRADHGTTIRLSEFAHRWVPSIDEFSRQLSQRFGIASVDWEIVLSDSTKPDGGPLRLRKVAFFDVDRMPETVIRFVRQRDGDTPDSYAALDASGGETGDLRAGFELDGRFYGVTGWVAYATTPYKDDLMAGVRIYCHGKIAAQTALFNLRAGFTGEHDVRSYLIGELHADWLDEEEDLIQTDRRDILWSHEVGQAFETWGQAVVKKMGAITRGPLRAKGWERFRVFSRIEERAREAFPLPTQQAIRGEAVDIAKLIGRTMRSDEMADGEYVESVVQLSLNFAPHLTLDNKLREAAESKDSPLAVITGILKTARIAELSSFGQIASDRVKVIEKVETLKDEATTLEEAFQDLITQAPWLIDPQWSP
ncbi:MAG TPA: ATP-binding protein, partial [Armatimonadota bacterium]|nr:ATP-binding protein [Armatimonadota bacterium]